MKKWNFRKPLLTALMIGGSLGFPFNVNGYYEEDIPCYEEGSFTEESYPEYMPGGPLSDEKECYYSVNEVRPLEYKTYPLENDFCSPKVSFNCLELGIDFIYWKPVLDDLDYVFVSRNGLTDLDNPNTSGKGKFRYAHFDWEPGFRIYVKSIRRFWEWNLSASYTDINPKTSHSTDISNIEEAPFLPTAIHGGYSEIEDLDKAHASWDFKYKDFDFLISYDFENLDAHLITPFIGVEILKLEHDAKINYLSTVSEGYGRMDWDGSFFGAGFKAGAAYHFDLSKNFYLNAKASASILNGDADYDYQIRHRISQEDLDPADFTLKKDECIFVSGFHIAIGVGFISSISNFPLKVEIGYEFVEWDNLPNPKKYWDNAVLLGIGGPSSLATLGFHGLKAGLSLSF